MPEQPIDSRPNYAKPAPHTHGSPSDLQVNPEVELRWYLPTWSERIRLMGWRNIFWLPSMLLVLLLASIPWMKPGAIAMFVFQWWQLWIVLIALPLVAAAEATRNALRLRREPFCIHCGYSLVGLPEGHNCPECGQPFHLGVVEDYRRDPHWFIDRYKNRNNIPRREATITSGAVRQPPRRDGT